MSRGMGIGGIHKKGIIRSIRAAFAGRRGHDRSSGSRRLVVVVSNGLTAVIRRTLFNGLGRFTGPSVGSCSDT